jgi:putative transcriptional regulator
MEPHQGSHSNQPNLTGSILVAVPTLLDPHFRRSILFLTRHDREEGAFGVILNRPSGQTLGECSDPPEQLRNVPVFEGGPVERENLLLARIQLMEVPEGKEGGARFESLHRDDAEELTPPFQGDASESSGFRAFAGYSGWTAGQLEREIEEKSWLILPPTKPLLQPVLTAEDGVIRWRGIMKELGSWYRLLAEAPDDLSMN